jgi:3-hydroxyacyl-[acyl-carrier-protein] dehydratase
MVATAAPPTTSARAGDPAVLRCPLDADRIRTLIPQSWPFLFIDRVVELQPGERGAAIKNVSVNEPYFPGHFPHLSVMPGVLIVESLAQLAGVVIASLHLTAETTGAEAPATEGRSYLAAVHRFRFRELVTPGDQLRLKVERVSATGALWEFRCQARVGTASAAEGRLVLAA